MARWLDEQGYFWAAQFNEYYTEDGWLAWSDGCFVPKEFYKEAGSTFIPRTSPAPAKKSFLGRLWKG